MSAILIIEDDPYVQRFYDRLFHLHNYEVELASNGEDGIAKAKYLKPPLIFLDIMMPGMDGIQVLEKLKADPQTKDIPVVMLTNLSDEGVVGKATKLGAAGFIIKSDSPPETLLALVDNYVKESGWQGVKN